ncbi:hypothetical protein [Tardiphaga sp.]|jgi:hypothetical protein
MIAVVVIIAMVVGSAAIGVQAGQACLDTNNVFTSIEEKNRL